MLAITAYWFKIVLNLDPATNTVSIKFQRGVCLRSVELVFIYVCSSC